MGNPMPGNTLTHTPETSQIHAKVLFDSGIPFGIIKKRTGLANDTLYAIKRNNEYSSTMLEEFKKRLPFKAYRLADNVIDLISLEEIKKAPLGVKMMAFGVAVDKARDMEGSNRPIFNIVTVVNDAVKTMSKLEAQMQLVQQARSARSTVIGTSV